MNLFDISKNKGINKNKELCDKYPFLIPRNDENGKEIENYDYSYTLLDDVPKGWRKLFLQMCDDLKAALIKCNYLYDYRFVQIKEKWGELVCYDNGAPCDTYDIISKYNYLSQYVCISCGSTRAREYSNGWVWPYCRKCFKKSFPKIKEKDRLKYICNEERKDYFLIRRYSQYKIEDIRVNVSKEWKRLNK